MASERGTEAGNVRGMKVRDVMSAGPVGLPKTATLAEAARCMREADIGDVLVMDGMQVCGLITDRDIVVRGVALDQDAAVTTIDDLCSHDPITVSPEDTVAHAAQLMRDRAIRRLPVLQNGAPVGIVALGDIAIEREPESALAGISAAAPNH
jgi:CBS domain-containing protein